MSEDTVTIPEVHIDVDKERQKPRLEALLLADYGSMTQAGKADVCGIFDRFLIDPEKKTTGLFYL